MNYRKINNICGWITGGIALIVYLKTMERSVSYWDCGEFISCAYKLEGGHAPGFPTLMMLQRLFALFAGPATFTGQPSASDIGHIGAATCINMLTSVMSAFTILFLFWTISYFAKKMIAPGSAEPDKNKVIVIIGAALVGALAYTFSDTFWFSAVEAIPFGTSPFFTAFTFWCILKWERVADNKYADRWLLLIALMIGLAVGVHLLILLVIPPIGMIYYFRRYPQASWTGGVVAFFASIAVLAFIMFGIIRYIPKFASYFDILFTNSFGAPFDVGAVTFLVVLVAGLVTLLVIAKRKSLYVLHICTLCTIFIIIGYSTYFSAIIRARAGVPINMTNPGNPNSFLDYVAREQFGEQPILYGQDYNSPVTGYKQTGDLYNQTKRNGKDYYEIVGKKIVPEYDPSSLRFFPRIYEGGEAQHASFYRSYLGLGKEENPTASDNLKYFWGYQMNWMWWRYFMWNYVGRQNDMEGQGDPKSGNWMSGIKIIDKMHGLGDTDMMGDGYKNNEARNELFFLPFILGLLGLVYQFNRNKKDGIVTLVLFFFTGAAIGIYLNMPPLQPRERDYAFAGCTYAFAIWIGLGVLMAIDLLQMAVKGKTGAIAAIVLCLAAVPTLMAVKEWGDHDRSKKTLPRATAYNVLMSCAPNAVLFTYGDNDTYPLWYLQEVEGIRRDIRIINTSLLSIDWYVDQLNYRINDADALPMIWKKEDYVGDRLNYIRYYNNPQLAQDKYLSLEEVCKFITDPANKLPTGNGESESYLPGKKFFVPTLSKEELVKNGLVKATDTSRIYTDMKFTFPKDLAYKSDLAILNIVAAVAKQGWKRPLYFDGGLPPGNYAGIMNFMKMEGLVYHLLPYSYYDSVKITRGEMGTIDIDKTYDLFMNTYMWGGADRKDVYFDEKNRLMFNLYRINASNTANGLITEGKKEEAEKLLDKVTQEITEHSYFYDYTAYFIATAYYHVGTKEAMEKGHAIAMKVAKNAEDDLKWIETLSDDEKQNMANGQSGGEVMQDIRILGSLGRELGMTPDTATASQLTSKAQTYYMKYQSNFSTGGFQQ